ncbi:uncharacterized protein [Hoplias malabaricus]|uniref:uncharacterized protein n=1 Tax=Hoplias malabaricus TaxID=27720 RepID=UPI0034621649
MVKPNKIKGTNASRYAGASGTEVDFNKNLELNRLAEASQQLIAREGSLFNSKSADNQDICTVEEEKRLQKDYETLMLRICMAVHNSFNKICQGTLESAVTAILQEEEQDLFWKERAAKEHPSWRPVRYRQIHDSLLQNLVNNRLQQDDNEENETENLKKKLSQMILVIQNDMFQVVRDVQACYPQELDISNIYAELYHQAFYTKLRQLPRFNIPIEDCIFILKQVSNYSNSVLHQEELELYIDNDTLEPLLPEEDLKLLEKQYLSHREFVDGAMKEAMTLLSNRDEPQRILYLLPNFLESTESALLLTLHRSGCQSQAPSFPLFKNGDHHPSLPVQRHCPRCPLDVAKTCQPGQPHNIQSFEEPGANLIHPRGPTAKEFSYHLGHLSPSDRQALPRIPKLYFLCGRRACGIEKILELDSLPHLGCPPPSAGIATPTGTDNLAATAPFSRLNNGGLAHSPFGLNVTALSSTGVNPNVKVLSWGAMSGGPMGEWTHTAPSGSARPDPMSESPTTRRSPRSPSPMPGSRHNNYLHREYIEERDSLPDDMKAAWLCTAIDLRDSCHKYFLSQIHNELKVTYRKLWTPVWILEHHDIIEEIEDKLDKKIHPLKDLNSDCLQELLSQLHFEVMLEYVKRMLKKKLKLKNEEQETAARFLCDDSERINALFIQNGSEKRWLCEILPKVSEVLKVQDPETLELEICALMKEHPDLRVPKSCSLSFSSCLCIPPLRPSFQMKGTIPCKNGCSVDPSSPGS